MITTRRRRRRREFAAYRNEARRDVRLVLDIDVTDGPYLTGRQRLAIQTWRYTASACRGL